LEFDVSKTYQVYTIIVAIILFVLKIFLLRINCLFTNLPSSTLNLLFFVNMYY
jgi:hypothetical protein